MCIMPARRPTTLDQDDDMLTHLGYGGRLAHGPQPRPRRRPGLQCALGPLNRFGFAQPITEFSAAQHGGNRHQFARQTQGGLFRHLLRRFSAEEDSRIRHQVISIDDVRRITVHRGQTVAASELAYWKALAEQRRREHGRKFAEEMERNARGSGLANY
jgi:hypothetical protein